MANRLKKILKPILDKECKEAFHRGFEEGKQAGWDKRVLAYENEIEFLKTIIRGLTKEEIIMCEVCGDNRFEVIKKAKEHLIESTNIEGSPAEMDVLDSFLYRAWQMGWLKQYE